MGCRDLERGEQRYKGRGEGTEKDRERERGEPGTHLEKRTKGSRSPRKVPGILEKEGFTSQAAIFILGSQRR